MGAVNINDCNLKTDTQPHEVHYCTWWWVYGVEQQEDGDNLVGSSSFCVLGT